MQISINQGKNLRLIFLAVSEPASESYMSLPARAPAQAGTPAKAYTGCDQDRHLWPGRYAARISCQFADWVRANAGEKGGEAV